MGVAKSKQLPKCFSCILNMPAAYFKKSHFGTVVYLATNKNFLCKCAEKKNLSYLTFVRCLFWWHFLRDVFSGRCSSPHIRLDFWGLSISTLLFFCSLYHTGYNLFCIDLSHQTLTFLKTEPSIRGLAYNSKYTLNVI